MPTDGLIRNSINAAGTHLASKYRGRAFRLPFGFLRRRPSVTLLTRRLQNLEEFRGGMLHVFIKVSVRMRIWPTMEVGAFKYAYNDSMAATFLNSGVLTAPNDTKEIEVDQTFKDLVSGAEDAVVSQCYKMFAQRNPSPTSVEAARRIFGVTLPSDVEIWKYKDYVDLYLWAQSRKYCVKRIHQNGAAMGCSMGLSSRGCACDRTDYNWIRDGLVLVKREIK